MLHFLCKSILGHGAFSTITTSPTHQLYFLQNYLSILSIKFISTTSNQHSFTVSYLMKSCGLSAESALSASKYVHFETPDRPDVVLAFLKNHGFSKTHITNLIRRLPVVLFSDTEKTLLPKLEFFYSKGVSSPDLAKILSSYPSLLKRSIDKQIIPSFNFFNDFFQSNENTIAAIKRFPGVLTFDLETSVAPNLNILREYGVPESNIVMLLRYQPRSIGMSSDRFKELVEEVKKMGFNPLRFKFAVAVFALTAMSKTTWERKIDVYKRWGWYEEDIFEAFGRHPWCMMASEDKIMAVMDFFVNKMGWQSLVIAKRPGLITLSLEKRLVPRGTVAQVLLSKNLLKKDFVLSTLFESPEKKFLEKFVNCYEEDAPQLLKLYKEKLDLAR